MPKIECQGSCPLWRFLRVPWMWLLPTPSFPKYYGSVNVPASWSLQGKTSYLNFSQTRFSREAYKTETTHLMNNFEVIKPSQSHCEVALQWNHSLRLSSPPHSCRHRRREGPGAGVQVAGSRGGRRGWMGLGLALGLPLRLGSCGNRSHQAVHGQRPQSQVTEVISSLPVFIQHDFCVTLTVLSFEILFQ